LEDSTSTSSLKPKTWGGFWDIFGDMLVDLLDIKEGANVLDIGTGGGAVLYPAAKRAGNSGFVTGVELCDHWVKAATDQIERCDIENAKVLLMDASNTGFDYHSFDYVTAGFIGWDDYFDFQAHKYTKEDLLMAEIGRVLKPGGLIGITAWLLQEDLDWMYQFLERHSILCKRNYSIENEKDWRKIMSASGFKDVQVTSESATYTYKSIEAWWKEMRDYDWILEGKDDDVITDSLKDDAFSSIHAHVTDEGGVQFKRDALFAIGRQTLQHDPDCI